MGWWSLSPFATGPADAGRDEVEVIRTEDGEVIDLSHHDTGGVRGVLVEAHGPQEWHGDTDLAVRTMHDQVAAGQRVVVVTEGPGLAERVRELLAEGHVHARVAEDRATRLSAYFRILARAFLTEHTVEMTPDRVGVALWARLPAGHRIKIPGYQSMPIILGEYLPRFEALDTALTLAHPTDHDHDYLAALAVHPDRQYDGIGSALLAQHLITLDRADRSAYVSATGPRARTFFLRHGFTDLGTPVGIGEDGPWVQPMWRDPAPRQYAAHEPDSGGRRCVRCGGWRCATRRRARAAMIRAGFELPPDEDDETDVCTACHGAVEFMGGRWRHTTIAGLAGMHDPVLPPIA